MLGADDIVALAAPQSLVPELRRAFAALSRGEASIPPRVVAHAPEGRLLVSLGYVPGMGLAAKFLTVFPRNRAAGVPSIHCALALFEESQGKLVAILDGRASTGARTAGTAALAAQLVARPESRVLAILGSGQQAAWHLRFFSSLFDLTDIRVASRDVSHAQALAHQDSLARPVQTFEDAVRGADIVCCCTSAPEPIVEFGWLNKGAHISSIGGQRELDPQTFQRGRLFVEWRGVVNAAPPAGAMDLGGLEPDQSTEIGEVVIGRRPGRLSPDDITVFRSVGHGVEDVGVARVLYDAALRLHVGRPLALD